MWSRQGTLHRRLPGRSTHLLHILLVRGVVDNQRAAQLLAHRLPLKLPGAAQNGESAAAAAAAAAG